MLHICREYLERLIKEFDSKSEFVEQCKKELEVINRLQMELITSGSSEDFMKRLKNAKIYFIEKEKYEKMLDKSIRYDSIDKFMKEKHVGNNFK